MTIFLSQSELGITNKYLFNDIVNTLKFRLKDIKVTKGFINQKINEEALNKADFLRLIDTSIENLDFLKHFPNLEELSISNISGLKDISGITYLSKLKVIDFYKTSVKDLSPLDVCSMIEDFSFSIGLRLDDDYKSSINSLSICNFSFLSRLPNLRTIDLSDCGINDLSFLSLCPNLNEITLNDNPISSTFPLGNLKNLEYLSIKNCNLTKIDGLEKFSEMKTLNSFLCNDNKFSDDDIKYYKENLSNVATLEF